MNYLIQVNTFFELLLSNPLSANAQCLYFNLLNINNRCNWQKEFTVANSTLMGFTNLNKQALYRARNELIQRKLIDFKKGINQNQSGKYQIIEFVTADDTANDTADDTPNDTPNDTADDTNNKLNKTKLKKKNIEKEFIAPSLEEVRQYVKEKKLNVDSEYFYNYFTAGNWIDSKGKEVKSWKQKLVTWHKHNTQEIKEMPNKPRENFTDLDTSQLTDEENIMLLQGKITIDELIQKGRIYVGRGT